MANGFACGYANAYGIYDLYSPIQTVNTGNNVLDNILGYGASTLNLIGAGINVLSNGIGAGYELANMASEAIIGMDLDSATMTLMANGLLAPAGLALKGFNLYMDSLKVANTSKAVNLTVDLAQTTVNVSASLVGIGSASINAFNNLPSNQGYSSFAKLKKSIGSAGKGNDWHHIVEQSQIKKSGFSPTLIHNTDNIIALDHETHMKITGYYSSKQYRFTNGLSIRDWLAGQDFESQYEFGIKTLKAFGVIE